MVKEISEDLYIWGGSVKKIHEDQKAAGGVERKTIGEDSRSQESPTETVAKYAK